MHSPINPSDIKLCNKVTPSHSEIVATSPIGCISDLINLSEDQMAEVISSADIELHSPYKGPHEAVRIFKPTHNMEIVGARKAIILSLLKYAGRDSQSRWEVESKLKDLQYLGDQIIRAHWGPPRAERFEFYSHKEKWSEFLESHLRVYTHFLDYEGNIKNSPAIKLIDDLKDQLKSIKADDPYIKTLLEGIPAVKRTIKDYIKTLKQAGIGNFPYYHSIHPSGVDSPFRSLKQYQEIVRNEMQEQGRAIEHFRNEIIALSKFIEAAIFISNNGMAPLQIMDGGPTKLISAYHPKLGFHNAVPITFDFDKDIPISFFTGHNGTGKSKVVETLALNWIYAQTFGFAFCKGGTIGVPRKQFCIIGGIESNLFDGECLSRGQREMSLFIQNVVTNTSPSSLYVLDEFLTSTDATGALAVVLATLEEMASQDSFSLVTIHNRDVDKIPHSSVSNIVGLWCPNPDGKYLWKPGIGHANVIELANEFGLPSKLATRATQIENELKDIKL